MNKTAIKPTRVENYPEWYQQVIRAADLAENSPVRGCMVIKPWGYALWENIQKHLDSLFKNTGHVNAYFPLFIPLSFFEKEVEHVEGFAKECAVVTHHRLETDPKGGLKPAGILEEPLVVRPTSETIIGAMYAKWIQSYRDLPVLINQWANVVRWEMRTRLFLRTTEFLWQEGHTAHETRSEAWEETIRMLNIYKKFAEEYMAIPVITGEKTKNERFPGALNTFSIEAMMQDRKALQSGTSHFLGQNFSKASGIQFQTRDGTLDYAWTTSWGVSTRLIGGMIMVHGDDNGVVIPPRLAPSHIVLLPIIRQKEDEEIVFRFCDLFKEQLSMKLYQDNHVNVIIDKRELNAGEKSWDWIKKGIPIIVEIGPRDIKNNTVFVYRRDKTREERISIQKDRFLNEVIQLLEEIQQSLFNRAKTFMDSNTVDIDDWKTFENYFSPKNKVQPELHGGFALSHWCGNDSCETKINDDLGVTIRIVSFEENPKNHGKCIICGKDSPKRVVFAKAY